ncbi:hypothetical protein RHMOL_Rhmol10G0275800 [Rhododendron molle]|uniref:Uncharacterized protein n=1 Tax=Rhododendron molle TaxID=49168 RepID=A0ACC0M783_RHOML|nr:hypothetical protein RHMOL_Rhmol10G0275800 [Rhododendron molle]
MLSSMASIIEEDVAEKMNTLENLSTSKENMRNTGNADLKSKPLTHAKSGSQDQGQEGSGPSNGLALPGQNDYLNGNLSPFEWFQ